MHEKTHILAWVARNADTNVSHCTRIGVRLAGTYYISSNGIPASPCLYVRKYHEDHALSGSTPGPRAAMQLGTYQVIVPLSIGLCIKNIEGDKRTVILIKSKKIGTARAQRPTISIHLNRSTDFLNRFPSPPSTPSPS